MASFTERMIGAATLNVKTYEEVEHDESATPQAMAVVALSVIASGIGTAGFGGSRGLVGGLVAAAVGWVVWAGIIFVVGTKLLPEPSTKADFGQLLRTIGFAASPGILLAGAPRCVGLAAGGDGCCRSASGSTTNRRGRRF